MPDQPPARRRPRKPADWTFGVVGSTGKFLQPMEDDWLLAYNLRRHRAWEEQLRRAASQATPVRRPRRFSAELRPRRFEPDLHLRVPVDHDLAAAGWGIIFPAEGRHVAERQEALEKLLTLRKAQASQLHRRRYRVFAGKDGYLPGETKHEFLARHGASPGGIPNHNFPQYLLLAGDPHEIPFEFQYQLDVRYAVGRIYFPRIADYEHYAESVVAAELAPHAARRDLRAAFFGPRHKGDFCTSLSSRLLVKPLAAQARAVCHTETLIGKNASKARLTRLLRSGEPPDFLFTAGHGLLFPSGHRLQRRLQGALVCQDWPGPDSGPVSPDHVFSADDIDEQVQIAGMVSFHFACFSAGCPAHNDFFEVSGPGSRRLARRAFLGRLPQSLLAHPRGGALAVIGHVESSFSSSIVWPGAGREIRTFQVALGALLNGEPVGRAMKEFGLLYAELAADEAAEFPGENGFDPSRLERLAFLTMVMHDARNYAILGDPAVRVGSAGPTRQHPREPVPPDRRQQAPRRKRRPRSGRG